MNTLWNRLRYLAPAFLAFPAAAFAQESGSGLETAIILGYYISTFGFLLATIVMALAVMQFGKSALGTIFTYFLVGTGIFFVITVFQTLGAEYFGIPDESMDVWWHLMFYMAMFSYYIGVRALVGLGSGESALSLRAGMDKVWGAVMALLLVVIFIIPASAEPVVARYLASPVAILGLHHFLSFLLAAVLGSYLLTAKKSIGQIGRAIANPMIIAIWALSLQHLWELQFESWETVAVTTEVGEGGEKIFLTIAALGVTYAAWRLKTYSRT